MMDIRIAIFAGVLVAGIAACSSPEADLPDELPEGIPWFSEVSESSGLSFTHVRSPQIRFDFPEIMSGGAAWVDYDQDGYPDLYLVQGGALREEDTTRPGNQLFRNIDGVRFEDVTQQAGVGHTGYGMGVAVGDYDNDGDPDVYVTNVGPNVLYRNEGGRFVDVTREAGVGHASWGTSAVFSDFDNDGLLDLYVVNYINWSPDREMECTAGGAGRDYCHPDNYRAPATDVLYHNQGDGTFVDVTEESGINTVAANGLGIVAGDFDLDGWQDFYIANDGNPNQLWINGRDGRFLDKATLTGAAVNRQGLAEAGMGVVGFDVEQDGDLDLFMTHLRGETNTFYRNQGGVFQDMTAVAGLSSASIPFTGFGTGYFDFDNDGFGDLFVANGRVGRSGIDESGDPFAEPNLVFKGEPNERFSEVMPRGGTVPELTAASRAAAFADYDRDGDIDVAVVNNGGDLHLLQNASEKGNWVGLTVQHENGSPVHCARVSVHSGDRVWWRWVQPGGGYQSSHDPSIHVGLGSISAIDSVVVYSAVGQRVPYDTLAVNTYHQVVPFSR